MKSASEDGRTRRARRKRTERRAAILRAAETVFGERGYHGTTVAHVIEGAGISRGTFYLYFDSLDDLFQELLDGFIGRLIAAVNVVDVYSDRPTLSVFEEIHHVELLFEHRALSAVFLQEAAGASPQIDARLDHFYDFVHSMMQGAVRNGMSAGLIRPTDPELVAAMVVGGIKEVLGRAPRHGEEPTTKPRQIAWTILDVILRGLLT